MEEEVGWSGKRQTASTAEIAASIVEDLQNALEQFMAIAEDLGGKMESLHL